MVSRRNESRSASERLMNRNRAIAQQELSVEEPMKLDLMTLVFWGLVISSSIWVYVDAKMIGVKKGQVKGLANLSPREWCAVCILLWIIGFPSYLVMRPRLKRLNGK